MIPTLKEITEELYPIACGKEYLGDDTEHENFRMEISWRMATAIHLLLLDEKFLRRCLIDTSSFDEESKKRNALWLSLAGGIISRLCKSRDPELWEQVPLDEYTVFKDKEVK